MKWTRLCLCGLCCLAGAMVMPMRAEETELRRTAAAALEEAEATCRADGGALWGRSLCGPVLLVDPATRNVWASRADEANHLKRDGKIFTGTLPNEINIANTAINWAGVKWTMIMLPLPKEEAARRTLIAHELWHRVQDEVGFPASGAANSHLDTRDGRYWLQLEWRALAAALSAEGDERKIRIVDAALFRAMRRQLFENAAREEREMELHEGLAEYTGVKLSGAADVPRYVVDENLKAAPMKKTFIRSFAYANGPAYGVLLDATGEEWRKTLRKGDDIAQLLFERKGIKLPDGFAAAAEERARIYGGADLAASEDERERTRRAVIADYRARFVDAPVLRIPLRKMNMQFDPGNLVTLDGHGTVYPNIRIVDVWGVLTVTSGGALMSADFTRVTLPAPVNSQGSVIEGNGWKLELKDGWAVAAGERSGDLVVKQSP